MPNSGRPVAANLLSAAPAQPGTTRPSSPTVTIQSGGATAAGAAAGCVGAAAGKSAAKAMPDAMTSNPTEVGHEADDMTTQLAGSGPAPGMFDNPGQRPGSPTAV